MCKIAQCLGFCTLFKFPKMNKRIQIVLGYYPKNTGVTSKLLDQINRLLDEKGYENAYGIYILKSGLRNPYKRITFKNAQKLILALNENKPITFVEKS
jgi:hypothetical protein